MAKEWIMTDSDYVPVRKRIFNEQNQKCAICGKELILHKPQGVRYDDRVMHIDHIIPKSLGGSNKEENLRGLCAHCNTSRNNRTGEKSVNGILNHIKRTPIDLFIIRMHDDLNVGIMTEESLSEAKINIIAQLNEVINKVKEI